MYTRAMTANGSITTTDGDASFHGVGATRARAEELLRALAGPAAVLRDDQWQAIDALVRRRRRVLLVQRTGWGKSAVYFLATALLRGRGTGEGLTEPGGPQPEPGGLPAEPGGPLPECGRTAAGRDGTPPGPTVIVSPLLALIRNQAAAAARLGIRAGEIHSANVTEWDEVYGALRSGELDVLLVGPERLNNPTFRDDYLPELAATTGLLVVDEAHCISDWGHDFRPDYRRLRTLIAGLRPDVPVLATTATANARVVADVSEQLGTSGPATAGRGGAARAGGAGVAGKTGRAGEAGGAGGAGDAGDAGTLVLRGTLDRESLRLAVVTLPLAEQRYAWVADHLAELPGSGIIYTLTKPAAEELTVFLRTQGHTVTTYHGGTEPAERIAAETDLLANRVKALVATSALGMGFDKPDLGFVVHVGAPASPIAYYQQIGRAGRAVDHAEVVLLPATEDADIWRYFADTSFPPERIVRQVLDVLAGAGGPISTQALLAAVDIGHGRLESMLKVLDTDGVLRRVKGGWETTGTAWVYDTDRYARVAAARAREEKAMLDYIATSGCRLEFLRAQLDDPYAAPCGRCDRCTGRGWPTDTSEESRDRARAELHRPGVVVEPRRMWPTGMRTLGLNLAGRIPAAAAAEPGRALARLGGVGWGNRLRPLLRPDAPDSTLPDDLVDAVVKTLAGWGWQRRPAAVAVVPSRRRPRLVGSLGERIATIGRLPLLGALDRVAAGPAASTSHNSAHRLAGLWEAFSVPAAIGERLGDLDGPVLLVDDLIVTGWTMTVAARLLREAGAPSVLPLALAVESG